MEPSQVSQTGNGSERPKMTPSSGLPRGTGAFVAATGRSLDQRSDQVNYRKYQHARIEVLCGPALLEVGAGSGDFSSTCTGRERLVVTDVDPDAVSAMAERFASRPEVTARQLDLASLTPEDAKDLAAELEPVDTVLAINVLEHIEDDVEALRALSMLVKPGGNLVMWVPGYERLYGDFDRSVGHFRRYTPQTLAAVARDAGLRVDVCRPVNLLGGIAWWAVVRKGGVDSSESKLVKIYDAVVVPISRVLDRFPIPFGQTILGSFTRPE